MYTIANTLSIDTKTQNVGINNSNPLQTLDIIGNINTSTNYNVDSIEVLSKTTLGQTIINSSLTEVGILNSLIVDGDITLDNTISNVIKMTNGSDEISLKQVNEKLDFINNLGESFVQINPNSDNIIISLLDDVSIPNLSLVKKNNVSKNQNFIDFYMNGSDMNNIGDYQGNIGLNAAGHLGFNKISDDRYKENIIEYENGYNILKTLRVIEFEWIDIEKKALLGRVVGYSAQEIEIVLPENVEKNYKNKQEPTDYIYSISQIELIPYNWSATRMLINKVETLEAKVLDLESEIAMIKTHLGL